VVVAGDLASSLSPNTPIKTGVYQGVVSVTPDGVQLLELGASGTNIAGTNDIYLRPGGLAQTAGARFIRNGALADLHVGSLCLYGTGTEVCQNGVPGGSGDTFWQSVVQSGSYSALSPSTTTNGVVVGTATSPIPGRAMEIYANTAAPALQVNGQFTTGFPVESYVTYQGGKTVTIAGRLQITNTNTFIERVRVWTDAGETNYVLPWDASFDGMHSRLDADTFDGTTSGLAFSAAAVKSIFWKAFSDSNQTYQVMCIRSDKANLCSGGANSGQVCSLTDPSTCPGGTCQGLCENTTQICSPTPTNGTCFNSGAPCTDANAPTTCGAGVACVRGDQISQTTASSCIGNFNSQCQTLCATTRVSACDGAAAGGATCSRVGTQVFANSGRQVGCQTATGPGVNTFFCDCHLSQQVTYLRAIPYTGGGGDLCSDIFIVN